LLCCFERVRSVKQVKICEVAGGACVSRVLIRRGVAEKRQKPHSAREINSFMISFVPP
jgi:hypothetical protein